MPCLLSVRYRPPGAGYHRPPPTERTLTMTRDRLLLIPLLLWGLAMIARTCCASCIR